MKSSPMMNGQLNLFHTTKLCVKEHFLPILKCTLTLPTTPIWSPFTVFTETELGVVCDVKTKCGYCLHVHAADFST